MEVLLNFEGVNWLAVVVATVAAFAAGAVWYGPILGKDWMKEVGLKKKDVENADMGKTYGASFLLMVLEALMVVLLVRTLGVTEFFDGLLLGALIGVLIGAPTVGINYLYQMKTPKLFAIDAGYTLIRFLILGSLLAIWQ